MTPAGGAVLGRLAGRRYLLRWRGVNVPGYTAMLYVGCVAGVLAGAAAAGAAGLDESKVALAMIALLIPALAGARLWFVVEHWGVFRREPQRIWRRSEGGSALHGGLVLSLAVIGPVPRRARAPVLEILGRGEPHDADRPRLHARRLPDERLLRRTSFVALVRGPAPG